MAHKHWPVVVLLSTCAALIAGDVAAVTSQLGSGTHSTVSKRPLLGGWRLACPFAVGGIAINFENNRLWLVGHAQRTEVEEFILPEMGKGSAVNSWPALKPVKTIQGWWQKDCYAQSLCWWKGKLWASPRHGYDTAPPPTLELSAWDGEKVVVKVGRQAYSGFVKKGPNQEPFVGSGGHESGQGWAFGPTLATLKGETLIKNDQRADWNAREKREPNYYPINHKDQWFALEPRTVNGVREGRWANDVIHGGGLALPEGITYWPWMGVGEIDYALQNETFAKESKTYVYRYDPKSFKLISWEPSQIGAICGHELDSQGRIYLSERYAWKSELYDADPIIRVYGPATGQ